MKKTLMIILSCVLAAAAILAALVYIPITRSLDYEMQGYLVSADGRILREFPLSVTGKEYNFIIDRPGGTISFRGTTLTQLERDAIILVPEFDCEIMEEEYTFGTFVDTVHNADKTIVIGSYDYYSAFTNSPSAETAMLDLAKGTYCMRSDGFSKGNFIVGITDPDTDLTAVIDAFLNWGTIPDLQR